MKSKKTRAMLAIGSALLLTAVTMSTPSQAEVLQQKWQAGQTLSYDLKIDGTTHLTLPSDVPMVGGFPLEILVKGDGQSSLEAQQVDDFGTAVVAPRLDSLQLKMNETTFNQKGVLGLRDGRANLIMNGQTVMTKDNLEMLTDPMYGLRITRQGRIVGATPLQKNAAAVAPAGDEKSKPSGKFPIDMSAMIQGLMASMMPAVLPPGDVNIGDSWKAEIRVPMLPAVAAASAQAAPAGVFNFKAIGVEEIAGRQTWRIAVDGAVKVDNIQTKIANDQLAKRGTSMGLPGILTRLPNFVSSSQKVKGSMWFDPALGQMVKADLQIDSKTQGRPALNKPVDGSMDFNGNVKLDLLKISYSSSSPVQNSAAQN